MRGMDIWAAALMLAMTGMACGRGTEAAERLSQAGGENNGYPTNLQELDRWYEEPPPGQDAAELIERTMGADGADLARATDLFLEVPEPGKAMSLKYKKDAQAFLQSHQAMLYRLTEAGRRPKARYSLDFSKGMDTELPHLAAVRAMVNLFMLKAIVDAEDGKAADAAQAVVTGVRLGETLAEEPSLISQLVRAACHQISAESVRHVLSRTTFTSAQLQDMQRAFLDGEERDTFYRCMVGERLIAMHAWQTGPGELVRRASESNGTPPELDPGAAERYGQGDTAEEDKAYLLRAFDEYISAARIPINDRLAEAKRVASTHEDPPLAYLVSCMFAPGAGAAVLTTSRDVAYLRCARTALAIEQYRLEKNQLPSTLSDLVPAVLKEVPLDPCTGTPLSYRRQGDGYMVYSVGVDQRDDAGLDAQEAKKKGLDWSEADFAVTVSR